MEHGPRPGESQGRAAAMHTCAWRGGLAHGAVAGDMVTCADALPSGGMFHRKAGCYHPGFQTIVTPACGVSIDRMPAR